MSIMPLIAKLAEIKRVQDKRTCLAILARFPGRKRKIKIKEDEEWANKQTI